MKKLVPKFGEAKLLLPFKGKSSGTERSEILKAQGRICRQEALFRGFDFCITQVGLKLTE
jgi:hypothetical protein